MSAFSRVNHLLCSTDAQIALRKYDGNAMKIPGTNNSYNKNFWHTQKERARRDWDEGRHWKSFHLFCISCKLRIGSFQLAYRYFLGYFTLYNVWSVLTNVLEIPMYVYIHTFLHTYQSMCRWWILCGRRNSMTKLQKSPI